MASSPLTDKELSNEITSRLITENLNQEDFEVFSNSLLVTTQIPKKNQITTKLIFVGRKRQVAGSESQVAPFSIESAKSSLSATETHQNSSLCLIAIDIAPKTLEQTVQKIPMHLHSHSKHEEMFAYDNLLEVSKIELIQNSHEKNIVAMVIDWKNKEQTTTNGGYQRSRSTDSRNGYNSRVSLDLSKKLYVFNIGLGLENSKEGEEKELQKDGNGKLQKEAEKNRDHSIVYSEVFIKEWTFEHVIWHPDVFFGLVVLTGNKVVFHNIETEHQFKVDLFNSQSIVLCNNLPHNVGPFTRVQIAKNTQKLESSNSSSSSSSSSPSVPKNSLCRKLTLFLSDRFGRVFGLFPFVCDGMIVTAEEKQEILNLIYKPESFRAENLREFLHDVTFDILEEEENKGHKNSNNTNNSKKESPEMYCMSLSYRQQQEQSEYSPTQHFSKKYDLFKATKGPNEKSTSTSTANNYEQSFESHSTKDSEEYKEVTDLQIFNIRDHTVFVRCMLENDRKLVGRIDVSVYTSEPYRHFLASDETGLNPLSEVNAFESYAFSTETVSELIGPQIQHFNRKKPPTFSSPEVKLGLLNPSFTSSSSLLIQNGLYFGYNNYEQCFKVDLEGLIKLLHGNKDVTSVSKIELITEVKSDMVRVMSIDENVIVMLRYVQSRKEYEMNVVHLRSITMKERVRKVRDETEEALKVFEQKWRKLHETQEKKGDKDKEKEEGKFPSEQIAEIEEGNLIEIEEKLEKFSEEYKETIEKDIFLIKSTYEEIQNKKERLELYNKEKQRITQLILKAEDNDKRINHLIDTNNRESKCRLQKEFSRRIENSAKMVRKIKEAMEKENEKMAGNAKQEEKEELKEYNEQADGVLKNLDGLKKQLLRKKDELMRVGVRTVAR